MEIDTKEDISKLSKHEISIRKEMLYRDKRFIQSKVIYWNEQSKELMNFERRIINREKELVGVCEMCGVRKTKEELEKERLKSLPTGEKVCKTCWNEYTSEILIKNANNIMKS